MKLNQHDEVEDRKFKRKGKGCDYDEGSSHYPVSLWSTVISQAVPWGGGEGIQAERVACDNDMVSVAVLTFISLALFIFLLPTLVVLIL